MALSSVYTSTIQSVVMRGNCFLFKVLQNERERKNLPMKKILKRNPRMRHQVEALGGNLQNGVVNQREGNKRRVNHQTKKKVMMMKKNQMMRKLHLRKWRGRPNSRLVLREEGSLRSHQRPLRWEDQRAERVLSHQKLHMTQNLRLPEEHLQICR